MQQKTLGMLYFQKKFGTDKAGHKQLCRLRWPEGFKCPHCGQAAAYPYLVLDARYEKVRGDGLIRGQAVQVAIGINNAGRRHILAVELANREGQTSWRNVLLEIKSRGLRGMEFVVAEDGVILISNDDHEASNLRKVWDEVYGEGNFMNQFVWNSPPLSQRNSTDSIGRITSALFSVCWAEIPGWGFSGQFLMDLLGHPQIMKSQWGWRPCPPIRLHRLKTCATGRTFHNSMGVSGKTEKWHQVGLLNRRGGPEAAS
jgi:hypothetical protein